MSGWRIGNHYSIHVYEGDEPIATFHDKADAIEAVLAVNAARAAGGSAKPAEVCPECRYERPPHKGPGTPVPMPGMAHSRDCPSLAWMEGAPEQREKLRADLAAITKAQRQAWRDSHNIIIGSAGRATQGAAPTPTAEICPRCAGTGRIPPPCDDFAAVTDPYTNQPSKLCFNCHRPHPKPDPHEFDRAHWLKHKPEVADTCCACGCRMDDPIHQRDEPQGTQSAEPKFGENGWLKAVQEGRVQAKGRTDG